MTKDFDPSKLTTRQIDKMLNDKKGVDFLLRLDASAINRYGHSLKKLYELFEVELSGFRLFARSILQQMYNRKRQKG